MFLSKKNFETKANLKFKLPDGRIVSVKIEPSEYQDITGKVFKQDLILIDAPKDIKFELVKE